MTEVRKCEEDDGRGGNTLPPLADRCRQAQVNI